MPTGIFGNTDERIAVYVEADEGQPLPKLVFTQFLTTYQYWQPFSSAADAYATEQHVGIRINTGWETVALQGSGFGWGTSHEIGHIIEIGECRVLEYTNNMVSNFNETVLDKMPSRGDHDKITRLLAPDSVLDGDGIASGGATIAASLFRENKAYTAGACHVASGVVKFEGCDFERNTSVGLGGAVFVNWSQSTVSASFDGCTITDNTSAQAGIIYINYYLYPNYDDWGLGQKQLDITNSVLRGNTSEAFCS